jgi:hypothetical protein
VDEKNAFDVRQLKLMLEKIREFQAHQISIGSLINDLEALLDCIKHLPKEWLSQMWGQWEILEINYAVVLDKEQHELTQEQAKDVIAAISKIKDLVTGYIKENFNEEDFTD